MLLFDPQSSMIYSSKSPARAQEYIHASGQGSKSFILFPCTQAIIIHFSVSLDCPLFHPPRVQREYLNVIRVEIYKI